MRASWTLIRRSFGQFRSNPMRTLLTLLGVVFGVGAVVAMMSIGEGAQRDILARIEAMGATSVHVRAVEVPPSEMSSIINESVGLGAADVEAIRRALGPTSAVTTGPVARRIAWRSRHQLGVTDLPNVAGAHEVHVLGVNPELFEVHALAIGQGRALGEVDGAHALRSAVLGAQLAKTAYPEGAIGKIFRLDYAYFKVVGVLAGRPGDDAAQAGGEDRSIEEMGSMFGQGGEGAEASESSGAFEAQLYEQAVLIPHETLTQELHPAATHHEFDMISVEVDDTAQTLPMKKMLQAHLSSLHGGVRDFEITAPEEILRQKQATQAIFNAVLISIAAISLIVGGIGVMNIMLANIMERVSEIGLRRAIGARRRDIRRQFLLEAISICVVGGAIGVALGLAASFGVSVAIGLPVAFAWESTALAFLISLITGVTFGLMPAIRAANINPIDALRGD